MTVKKTINDCLKNESGENDRLIMFFPTIKNLLNLWQKLKFLNAMIEEEEANISY
jgi:hypothetical protein